MSKRTGSSSDSKASLTYWRQRVYRNSYTRGGQQFRVRGWCVKVQLAGQRQTWRLQAKSREAAAAEARERFLAAREPLLATPMVSDERLRLVRRPHPAPGAPIGELALQWSGSGPADYYPLGTANPIVAGRRARRLHGQLIRDPLNTRARVPRELTVALEWCSNPVVWTYFTFHSRPDSEDPSPAPATNRRGPRRAVAVVEPELGLRQALLLALNQHLDFAGSTGFANASEALAGLAASRFTLVLINQSLEGLSGAGFLDRLRVVAPSLPGLIYTTYPDSDRLFAATPGGASGYLLKRSSPDRFLEPLLPLSNDESLDQSSLASRARAWFQRVLGAPTPDRSAGELSRLTSRELEILALLSKGFVDKEIAQSLRISVWTVHGHAKNIYEKLGVHSRTEAAVKYLQK